MDDLRPTLAQAILSRLDFLDTSEVMEDEDVAMVLADTTATIYETHLQEAEDADLPNASERLQKAKEVVSAYDALLRTVSAAARSLPASDERTYLLELLAKPPHNAGLDVAVQVQILQIEEIIDGLDFCDMGCYEAGTPDQMCQVHGEQAIKEFADTMKAKYRKRVEQLEKFRTELNNNL